MINFVIYCILSFLDNRGTRLDEWKGQNFLMLIRLDETLQPLIEAFNRDRSKHRFVTILSPT